MPPSPQQPTGTRRRARLGAGPRIATTATGIGRWLALGVASGVLAGLACWAFLTALDHVTQTRLDHPWLIWFLPAGGVVIAGAYARLAGRAAEGNALLLDEIHRPTAWVPRRMAPLVALGTLASHLVGASVGREGTALQLSGSLSDGLARLLRLRPEDRRILLTAALAGGFGATFGVPWAGAVFGLEVQRLAWHAPRSATVTAAADGRSSGDRRDPGGAAARSVPWWVPNIGRLARGDRAPRPVVFAGFRDGTGPVRIVAAFAASFVGNRVVVGLGRPDAVRPALHLAIDAGTLARCAVAGVAFGVAALVFIEATDGVRALAGRIPWASARPALGGLVVIGAAAVVGRSYLGLSLPLIGQAVAGDATGWQEPVLKLGLTAVCLGTGFIGGEVTPLFVIGATLGAALSPALGLPPAAGAAIGFAAVFGAAANTPIASVLIAVEAFGPGAAAPAAMACATAYLASGRRGMYATQLRRTSTGPVAAAELPGVVERFARRRSDRSPRTERRRRRLPH